MKKAAVSKGANKKKVAVMTHVIEPNAAGIDVGSTEMFVAVPVDRDPQPVRRFTTFTNDLVALADWLKTVRSHQCRNGIDRRVLDSVVSAS
jgi:transposase